MLIRTLATAALMLGVSAVAPDEPRADEWLPLRRLAAASQHLRIPAGNGIRAWRQTGSTTGISASVDAGQQPLSRVIALWDDRCEGMDLENVAVVSDAGRQIRFFDLTAIVAGKQPDPTVKRGDTVLFLQPGKAG